MSNKIKIAEPKNLEAFHDAQASHDFRNQQSPGKTKEVLSLFATAILPIVGALGTLFVFLVVNYYVGDVDIAIPNGYQTLEVHAYNQKGQDAIFHTPHFQLMPDRYHFEVSVNGKPREHADAAVQFRHATKVILLAANTVNTPPATDIAAQVDTQADNKSEQESPAKTHSKRWWQFWKKSSDN